MTKKFYVNSLISSLIFVILIICTVLYLKINTYNDNRIYNLRLVDTKFRTKLLEQYIDRVYKNNSILIIGDSQPNGHRFPTEFIFSTLIQKELNKNVINMAFQDSRILDNTFILEYCDKKNYKFDKIIFNVNQSHIKQSDFQHLDLKNNDDYKLKILTDIKSFYKLAFYPNPTNTPSDKLHLSKYKNYFDMNDSTINSYLEKLKNLIKLSNKITNNMIVYITPHSLNAVDFNNKADKNILSNFNNSIFNFCRKNKLHCFEPNITEDKYYIDIVHLNSVGHKKMADIILNELTK